MPTNAKNKGGRPKKYDIDPEEVFKLASYGCTNTEIADFFGCSKDLISKSYSTNVLKGRTDLKKRLRKAQIEAAQADRKERKEHRSEARKTLDEQKGALEEFKKELQVLALTGKK